LPPKDEIKKENKYINISNPKLTFLKAIARKHEKGLNKETP